MRGTNPRKMRIQKVKKETGQGLPRLAFTMHEVAEILGISYISVHRLLKRGLLKSSTSLRHKIISASELERFLRDTSN